jgi:acetyl esterase
MARRAGEGACRGAGFPRFPAADALVPRIFLGYAVLVTTNGSESPRSGPSDGIVLSPLRLAYGALERRALRSLLDQKWLRRALARRRAGVVDGRRLDEELAAMLRLADFDGRSSVEGCLPAEGRRRLALGVLASNPAPPSGVDTRELDADGPNGPVPLRHYEPAGLAAPSPGIVFFHGGGWVTGSIDTHDGACRLLASLTRCRVVSVDYRLAPEHPFPAGVQDCVAATRWVLAHAAELGIDAKRVALTGDSAGGNLSAVVALHLEKDALRPALQAPLYAAFDGTCSDPSHRTFAEGYLLTKVNVDWYYGHYLGYGSRTHPDVSPLYAATVSTIPALIYTAGFDPLRDEGARYAEKLRAAGTPVRYHEFPDLTHGFLLLHAVLRARQATERIAADIVAELSRC